MTHKKEFPLFPILTEHGQIEAQELIDKFKAKLNDEAIKIAENITGEFYCDIATYIESDSWNNFRNDMMDGFKNYDNKRIQNEYDFKEIRKAIFEENKEEIIKDLDQDNLDEIKKLKDQIEFMQSLRH